MEDHEGYRKWIKWENKFYSLVNNLLEKNALLNQYAILLKSSKENDLSKGGEVYQKLTKCLQNISGDDFISGPESKNLIAVIGEVQRRMGLDLGVCRYLVDNIIELKKFEYMGIPLNNKFSSCSKNKNLEIRSLNLCLPPERIKCIHRRAD